MKSYNNLHAPQTIKVVLSVESNNDIDQLVVVKVTRNPIAAKSKNGTFLLISNRHFIMISVPVISKFIIYYF